MLLTNKKPSQHYLSGEESGYPRLFYLNILNKTSQNPTIASAGKYSADRNHEPASNKSVNHLPNSNIQTQNQQTPKEFYLNLSRNTQSFLWTLKDVVYGFTDEDVEYHENGQRIPKIARNATSSIRRDEEVEARFSQ